MMTFETFTALMALDLDDALMTLVALLGADATEDDVERLDDEGFDWAEETGHAEQWAWLVARLEDRYYVEDYSDGDPWDE